MIAANDPRLESFIPVARDSHFPIQNLPFGVFSAPDRPAPRAGVAIGESVLDLAVLCEAGLLEAREFFNQPDLNVFMAAGRSVSRKVRDRVSELLRADNPSLRDHGAIRERAFVPMARATMHLPARIGDYTDFYASREHATNVGTMFRGKDNALMPNWLWLPVGYHGRASSIVVSGTDVQRPLGQSNPDDSPAPVFGPSRLLDFELEVAAFVGSGNELGQSVSVAEAADHLFGLVLMNDWSARDVQKWEYVPLGPFLAKNFATSISPWIVTLDALEPFRVAGPAQEPEPLPYLKQSQPGSFDIQLEVNIQGAKMDAPFRVCAANFRAMYWSVFQQLAHHTIGGCNLRPGDLLGSGTISGSTPDSYGSLLELTWRGSKPLKFPNGEERKFLQDGDRVTMTGWCQGDGYRVGFGEVTGTVLPALDAVRP
ncbi:fumarylacetoacetase [Candidatus Poribacteria bacterium]|nr:fumarylacetoacetase [Candidatus Poribacteria bacterium]